MLRARKKINSTTGQSLKFVGSPDVNLSAFFTGADMRTRLASCLCLLHNTVSAN